MKAVILAGGLGTRISEESHLKPKPMIEIGGKPIIWHILKIYSSYGINDFIICLGYRGYVLKEYFANYFLHTSDVTFDLSTNSMEVHERHAEPWRITLVDTGENTQTGGRLRRVRNYLEGEAEFCFTYGDGVGNVDIGASIAFHRKQGTLATVTAATPPGRFGMLEMNESKVIRFNEKPKRSCSKNSGKAARRHGKPGESNLLARQAGLPDRLSDPSRAHHRCPAPGASPPAGAPNKVISRTRQAYAPRLVTRPATTRLAAALGAGHQPRRHGGLVQGLAGGGRHARHDCSTNRKLQLMTHPNTERAALLEQVRAYAAKKLASRNWSIWSAAFL